MTGTSREQVTLLIYSFCNLEFSHNELTGHWHIIWSKGKTYLITIVCWNTWWAKEKEFLYIDVFPCFIPLFSRYESLFSYEQKGGQAISPICVRTELHGAYKITICIFRTVSITYSFSCWETFRSVATGKIRLIQQVVFISGEKLAWGLHFKMSSHCFIVNWRWLNLCYVFTVPGYNLVMSLKWKNN